MIIRYKSYVLIAGGNWNNSAYCSSRYRKSNNVRSTTNENIGGRGSIRGEEANSKRNSGSSLLTAGLISLARMPENKRREVGASSR